MAGTASRRCLGLPRISFHASPNCEWSRGVHACWPKTASHRPTVRHKYYMSPGTFNVSISATMSTGLPCCHSIGEAGVACLHLSFVSRSTVSTRFIRPFRVYASPYLRLRECAFFVTWHSFPSTLYKTKEGSQMHVWQSIRGHTMKDIESWRFRIYTSHKGRYSVAMVLAKGPYRIVRCYRL